jgi:hypothetical protein
MRRRDDPFDDMSRFPSSADADRLLSGRLSLDDLPGEAALLARLLQGLVPSAVDDPFTERRVVSDMAAEILRNPASETMPSQLRSGGTRMSAKAGALAFAAVLATGTAAAAANGSLPAGLQRTVSDALSHVSISVPRPAPHRTHPVESQNGGTDGHHNGGSPGGATGPVTPRGVGQGKDDDKTPRGVTNKPGTTVPKTDNGQHNGADNGKKKGQQTTPTTVTTTTVKTDNGAHNGGDNGKKQGQQTTPTTVTTTTVKANNGKRIGAETGADNGNAGVNGNENGNADSHAKQRVSGSGDGS